MWAKLSFRLKITVIFSLCLTIVTIALTAITLINVRLNITTPMHERINIVSGINESNSTFLMGNINILVPYLDREFYPLTEEQIEEIINNIPNDVLGNGVIHSGSLQEQLNTSQLDFSHYSFWIAGLVIIFGSVGAYLVAGLVVNPIKNLSTSIKDIEAHKLDMNIPLPKSNDEIFQLAVSFNLMLNKLHHSFESKQLFAQNASHELKTPLAIIRADMEVLEMDDNPTMTDYEEVFAEVRNNTERMIDLVEGMLAMGKTLTEKDMITIEMREIFEGILSDLKADILSKQLTINIEGELTLQVEKTLFRQALSNLVHNAVRYNVESGSIHIILSQNQITISDTGIGIPPESISQLFDPFYRVDNSRSKKIGGNGLGLAITKNILASHQMDINVHSEIGKGTSITIQIHG